MDNWFERILLGRPGRRRFSATLVRAVAMLSVCVTDVALSAEPPDATAPGDKPGAVQVIPPDVKPREVKEAAIDSLSLEFGVYAGNLTIDNFSSELLYGASASFHASEDFFLQMNYGMSRAGRTSFETLSGSNINLLSSSDRNYSYYDFLVGYNIFPGEIFMTSKLTFNSAFYLVAGVGNTSFGGEDNFTTTLGTGYRIVLRDWLTWHVDYRDHIFQSDIIEKNQTTHNIEFSTGISVFF